EPKERHDATHRLAGHRTAAARAVDVVAARPAQRRARRRRADGARTGGRTRGAAGDRRRLPRLAARRSARHPGPDRARRPVPAPPGRWHVPEPRTPAAVAAARLLPRIHRAHARVARSRRAPHRRRRSPAGGGLLHRRPLPQLPPLHPRGGDAMTATELGALLADASQNGAYFVDVRDREGLEDAARGLGFAVAAVDFTGCRDKDEVLERFAAALRFPDWF